MEPATQTGGINMCGRFTQPFDNESLQRRFGLLPVGPKLAPRYNVAPGQEVGIVRQDDGRRLELMRWGLVPAWAKDPKKLHATINARAETLAEKPFFKGPLQRQRCLVPADGFYEWAKEGKDRLPYRFVLKKPGPFAFAGLWEARVDQETGEELLSFTIITTRANELVSRLHDRMPVILCPEFEEAWLTPEPLAPEVLGKMLVPYAAGAMDFFRVSTRVNSARNEGPDLIEPVAEQGGLFEEV